MSGNDELELIRQSATRFAVKVVRPALHALNHYPDAPLPERLFSGLAELGLFDLAFEEDGGARALAVALEALADVAAAPAASVLAHVTGRELAIRAGGERLIHELDGHATRPTFAYPIYAEPTAPLGARVRRSGDAITLEGRVELLVNAPRARVLVFPAADLDHAGALALVAIESSAAGVQVGEPLLTLGMRGCPTADVVFRGVRVPADRLLAPQPRAAALIDEVTRCLRGPAAAICTGVLGSSLRAAAAYAKERYQGGHAIIEHQEVRAILARMIEDHALCREAVDRLSQGAGAEVHALALFVHAKERAAHATCDGVQLLGGNGYMEDFGQERCMRDAKQAQCLFGRTDWLRQRLATAFAAAGAQP